MSKQILRPVLVLMASAAFAAPLFGQTVNDNAAAPASTQPANPDQVVISIADEKITVKDFEEFIAELPAQYQMLANQPGPFRRELAENLVRMKLMAVEARDRKLDESPAFKRQMELMKQQMLASALAQEVMQNLGEEAMRQYYEENKDTFTRIKARHILVRTQDSVIAAEEGAKPVTDAEAKAKADELRRRVEQEDFATVARAESADRFSASRGGDLGVFSRGQLRVPEFDEVAFALKEGEISQPVRTVLGYHIIQVQERTIPTFEEVRPQIEQEMGPQRLEKLVQDLEKKHQPTVDDAYFGPRMQNGAAAPGQP